MSKQRHQGRRELVVQHLEGISGRILDDYPELLRQMMRRRAGVYSLYRRGRLYYVGLAGNLMSRLQMHLKDRHHGVWDRFSVYFTVRDDHIKEMESLLLRITKPAGNKQGGKFVASENLLSTLNRLMSDTDADRRARLLGGYVVRRRRRAKAARARGTRILAGVVDRRIPLRARHKKRQYKATLRKDGSVRFARSTFGSPSAAARAALGRSCNGWWFWRFRNERGEWVPLEILRR